MCKYMNHERYLGTQVVRDEQQERVKQIKVLPENHDNAVRGLWTAIKT